MITGAGHSSNFIRLAVEDGCDTYITGEATLYTIQYAQFVGINLLVGSHTFTEIFGVESVVREIQKLDCSVRSVLIQESHLEVGC